MKHENMKQFQQVSINQIEFYVEDHTLLYLNLVLDITIRMKNTIAREFL